MFRSLNPQKRTFSSGWMAGLASLALAAWLLVAPATALLTQAAPTLPANTWLSYLSDVGETAAEPVARPDAAARSALSNVSSNPSTVDEMAAQVAYLVNQERGQMGLPPLKLDASLSSAALAHSRDMAVNNFFGHTSSNGNSLVNRLISAGYVNWTTGGENIAAGYPTAEEVVAAWMSSPGHRANILNANYREIGVGLFYQPDDQATVSLQDGSVGGPYF